jgi:hypothetical protein
MVIKTEHPVTISMDVNEQGVPGNLHLVKLTEAEREKDALAAMREWRFRPGVAAP